MKYMGSKNRIAKHILPIILKDRKEGQCYVEPFVGGANIIDKVDGWRIGSDSNKYLIAFLRELQTEWIPPENITKEHYQDVKDNTGKYEDYHVGYIGFMFSFGAKWFGGFVGGLLDKGKKRDRVGESYRNAIKTKNSISGINLKHSGYKELEIPVESIIYCDPPYKNTTSYKDGFNHDEFYEYCRKMSAAGHKVFISEYNMPDDFKCVWSKEISNTLTKAGNNLKPIEKLFTI